MKKPFYYEGNYHKNMGSDCHYAIITIEEGGFSIEDYEKEYGKQDIEFGGGIGGSSGKYKVEYGSNMSGTEEVSFVNTIEDAKSEYARMEDVYCDDMCTLSKPLEDYIINNEEIPKKNTPAQNIVNEFVKKGEIKEIKLA
jgi:hypothetical protein